MPSSDHEKVIERDYMMIVSAGSPRGLWLESSAGPNNFSNPEAGFKKPGKETMKNPIKILHVNQKKEGTYFLICEGLFIRSSVSRKGLKKLLKAVKPDLIISDPSEKTDPGAGIFKGRLFQLN
jgi:hypothetical protein